MKNLILVLLLCLLFFISCNDSSDEREVEKWKTEILEAEKDFNDLAQKEGITKAFKAFAAPDGVIKRGNEIIKGNQAIAQWYAKNSGSNETLSWKPDFVDVSNSGDLGYTYGSFRFTSIDSLGNKEEATGKFHTVWKRQADGTWKFVWD